MSGIVSLSYALSNNTAYYGGSRLNLESRVKETGNKFTRETNLCFSSHSGTHLDFPSHFYRDGKKGNDYPLDFFIFHRAAVVECNLLDADGKIDGSLMKGFALEQGLELILVKTHFCSIRGQERILEGFTCRECGFRTRPESWLSQAADDWLRSYFGYISAGQRGRAKGAPGLP